MFEKYVQCYHCNHEQKTTIQVTVSINSINIPSKEVVCQSCEKSFWVYHEVKMTVYDN